MIWCKFREGMVLNGMRWSGIARDEKRAKMIEGMSRSTGASSGRGYKQKQRSSTWIYSGTRHGERAQDRIRKTTGVSRPHPSGHATSCLAAPDEDQPAL